MFKGNRNLPLGVGLLVFGVSLIIKQFFDAPEILNGVLLLTGLAFEFWGGILAARSPEFKNSKLRQWKLRLIGRDVK